MKAKKKPAEKNKRGLDRIQRTVKQLRDEYESKYPFAVDYGDVQTPEGMPTFEEFVNSKSAGRAYNEADPLWQYQKTTQLGPLAYQRWRGAQTSVDGKNYRTPYVVLPTSEAYSPKQIAAARSQGEAGSVAGTAGLTTNTEAYKEGHRLWLENRTRLDKAKGIAGSLVPPANYLSGRGAAIGGRNIPEALNAAWLAKSASAFDIKGRKDVTTPQVLNALAAGQAIPASLATDVVVPTGGFRLNPFGKAVRGLKKDARKDQRKLDKKLLRGTRFYEQQAEKEKANLEREASLYEKKYGVRPTLPNQTMNYKPAAYTPGEGRRTENRNPVFLKNGGLLFMKPKGNRNKK